MHGCANVCRDAKTNCDSAAAAIGIDLPSNVDGAVFQCPYCLRNRTMTTRNYFHKERSSRKTFQNNLSTLQHRSLGDSIGESVGVFAEPEQLVLNVSKNDKFIVVASDGVFEFITSHKVCRVRGEVPSEWLRSSGRNRSREDLGSGVSGQKSL